MKKGLFLILALLVLVALANYFYKKFVIKPKIQIDIFTNKILTEQKIYYTVNYSGVKFSGVYDLKGNKAQDQQSGPYKIKTTRNGLIFGLQIEKDNAVLYSVNYDITKQQLTLNL